MNVPILNRKLVLETREQLPDGAGGVVETWVALGTLWAGISGMSGAERDGGDTPVSVARLRVTLRAAPEGSSMRPRPGQRLREGERRLAVRSVTERDRFGRYLTCIVEEEVAT